MKVNHKNYQEYLVRFIDGELLNEEENELRLFLKEYPELESDLNAFDETILKADESIVFLKKETLQKGITTLNYPEYFVRFVDGGLSSSEYTDVITFLNQYPQFQPVMHAYKATVLVSDSKVSFPDKESLKHRERKIITINIRYILTAAVAAVIFFLFMMQGVRWKDNISSVPLAGNKATHSLQESSRDIAHMNQSKNQKESDSAVIMQNYKNDKIAQGNTDINLKKDVDNSQNIVKRNQIKKSVNIASVVHKDPKHYSTAGNQQPDFNEKRDEYAAVFTSDLLKMPVAKPHTIPVQSRMNRAPYYVFVNESKSGNNELGNSNKNTNVMGWLSIASLVGEELLRITGRGELIKNSEARDETMQIKTKNPVAVSVDTEKFSFYHKFFKKRNKRSTSTH
ncbi:MAG: hypothetical protein H0W62_07475 [Chitinophagales bacterium]|nr:hypothetical protein [Chitinophagales bacterium]